MLWVSRICCGQRAWRSVDTQKVPRIDYRTEPHLAGEVALVQSLSSAELCSFIGQRVAQAAKSGLPVQYGSHVFFCSGVSSLESHSSHDQTERVSCKNKVEGSCLY